MLDIPTHRLQRSFDSMPWPFWVFSWNFDSPQGGAIEYSIKVEFRSFFLATIPSFTSSHPKTYCSINTNNHISTFTMASGITVLGCPLVSQYLFAYFPLYWQLSLLTLHFNPRAQQQTYLCAQLPLHNQLGTEAVALRLPLMDHL